MPAYDVTSFDPPAPVARVTLRNSESGTTVSDVSMLLDSGADVSLVPALFVNRLGLTVDASKVYELTGFAGGTSYAPVARLELFFLNRTFRGRFLLIDQEWGILGRDVLNFIPLLLDGPNLTWGEQSGVR